MQSQNTTTLLPNCVYTKAIFYVARGGKMGLAPETKLGRYEFRELIGEGGMGEVYRGYDT